MQAITRSYEHTRAKVNSPDGEIDTFNILAVLQGDTLAPYLFTDHALRKAGTGLRVTLAPRRSRRVPAVTVTNLNIADIPRVGLQLISKCSDFPRKKAADTGSLLTHFICLALRPINYEVNGEALYSFTRGVTASWISQYVAGSFCLFFPAHTR